MYQVKSSLIHRLHLAAQISRGLFLFDPHRTGWGKAWQLFSRFTWELPQTLVGWLYSLSRALAGQVDRVDTFGGITFVTKARCRYGMGVSLGSFVNLWTWRNLKGENEKMVVGDQLCMHEFGHTTDSQRFGWAYLPVIGLPSLMSALGKGNHDVFWTEIRANRYARRYFSKYYSVAWDESGYPTEYLA